MAHFYTTDNNLSSPLKTLATNTSSSSESPTSFQDANIHQADYNNISRFANIPLEQLVKDNPSLLVFPRDLGRNDDGIEENPILTLSGSCDDLQKVKITTSNMMGFIGSGDTELSITSRFAQNSNEDYFLHYMLQKVMAINVFQMEHSTSHNNEMDFLLYVFPNILKKALAQGVYKTYQTFNKNDAAVKGVIDVPRHIKDNIPFAGKIAYKSRERTAENFVMHLIRHTIEYIKTKPCGASILSSDKDVASCIQTVYGATQNYNIREREKIISKNIKPFCHPYYTAYKPLVTLCLLILRHQKLKYATESKKVYGILFDGAWLWEEYLATILTKAPLNFTHGKNKTHENGINVYDGRKFYPDFYRGKQGKCPYTEQTESNQDNNVLMKATENNFILDAKYKRLGNSKNSTNTNNDDKNSSNFNRDDLHQLITYMHILPARRGALIYPSENGKDKIQFYNSRHLFGLGGEVSTIGFPIPQNCTNVFDFRSIINTTENDLLNNKILFG